MTAVIIGSVAAGFIVGTLATILAATAAAKRDQANQPTSETPIFDTIKPSLTVLEAEAITRRAAADAEWAAIKAGDR